MEIILLVYKTVNVHIIQLIILEKYATSFNAFLEYEKIQIPAIRDSSGILYDHDLLPRTPMKIFIDKKGDVKRIAPIGADIDPAQDAFIASLKYKFKSSVIDFSIHNLLDYTPTYFFYLKYSKFFL